MKYSIQKSFMFRIFYMEINKTTLVASQYSILELFYLTE